MKPEELSFLFLSPEKIEAYPHTNWEAGLFVSLQLPYLMASFHTSRHSKCGTGKGPLKSLQFTSFFDFCQLTLQVFSKVTHYLCEYEKTLCRSRVCEIMWNRIESSSGKVIAVGISFITKPHPGLNDVICNQLHLITPPAEHQNLTTAMTLSLSPLCEDKKGRSYKPVFESRKSAFHTGKCP